MELKFQCYVHVLDLFTYASFIVHFFTKMSFKDTSTLLCLFFMHRQSIFKFQSVGHDASGGNEEQPSSGGFYYQCETCHNSRAINFRGYVQGNKQNRKT